MSFQEGKAEFKGIAYKPGLMGNRAPFRRGSKLQVQDSIYCEQGGAAQKRGALPDLGSFFPCFILQPEVIQRAPLRCGGVNGRLTVFALPAG